MRNSNLDASLRGHDNFSFQAYQQRIHDALLAQLPPVHEPPELLHKAMHYAVFNGGKRLRPLLVYAIGNAFNVNLDKLDLPACAVEFIHSYSLIHDDLPAMDNDDWRRGKPSCHKAFDEATAILAGDALQTLAFETLSCLPKNLFSDRQKLLMIHTLSLASGSRGMAGGQALDIMTIKSCNHNDIEITHQLKTGALINASIQLGMIAAEIRLDSPTALSLKHYGNCLGFAFQIQDDILDVEGHIGSLGKYPGGDNRRGKITYVSLNGLDKAKEKLIMLQKEVLDVIDALNKMGSALHIITNAMINRL